MLNKIKKIKEFSKRNGESLIIALTRRYMAGLYTHSGVRKLLSPFFVTRMPKKWIFLVGCYNSGTTICRDVLGIHPEISCLPREGVRFTSLLPRPEERGWTRMWVGCPEYMKMPAVNQEKIAAKIKKDWSPWWDKSKTVFLEKSITNVTRMKWLDDNFENAYFLGITRNAYPVIEGIRRRAFPSGEAKDILGSEKYSLEMTAGQWVDANSRLLEGQKVVKNCHIIKYENLVEDPETTLDGLWRFLDITPEEVRFDGINLSIGNRQIQLKNMNQESISRLTMADIEMISPIIKDVQECLQYEMLSK